ncbi:hypothetical protein [Azorhizophilus paspali]|uniref:hypothetical protein n=1 Tax=Azorhizophilus paspali TaxID=69963 RepID=UPI003631990C
MVQSGLLKSLALRLRNSRYQNSFAPNATTTRRGSTSITPGYSGDGGKIRGSRGASMVALTCWGSWDRRRLPGPPR